DEYGVDLEYSENESEEDIEDEDDLEDFINDETEEDDATYAEDSDDDQLAPYVSDVVRRVTEIHKTEEEWTILAFLTSQMEVEWACEQFKVPLTVALPLHGRL
ncbi:hypothetical protein Tco_0756996, partial [Tanacetum coccineum]